MQCSQTNDFGIKVSSTAAIKYKQRILCIIIYRYALTILIHDDIISNKSMCALSTISVAVVVVVVVVVLVVVVEVVVVVVEVVVEVVVVVVL